MAEFILLGVVRKLSDVLSWRHVENKQAREKTDQFLRDLYIHNYNKRGLFYLPKDANYGIGEDSVADLRVVFSVHRGCYSDVLRARRGAITELYAAHLGHMIGHMFSRVALPGWQELRPDIKLGDRTKSVLDGIHDRDKSILSKLLEKAKGAPVPAVTGQQLPTVGCQ
jgi:hypothetical protein